MTNKDLKLAGAYLIKTSGEIKEITPKNGSEFSLEELQGYVGGYIEAVSTKDERTLIVNEEGKINGLEINSKATDIYGYYLHDVIVGDAVLINNNEWFK